MANTDTLLDLLEGGDDPVTICRVISKEKIVRGHRQFKLEEFSAKLARGVFNKISKTPGELNIDATIGQMTRAIIKLAESSLGAN